MEIDDKINFRDANRYFTKGVEILDGFKKQGLTLYQSKAIIELYNKNLLFQELRKKIEIENSVYFSSNIITPLRKKGYIETKRNCNQRTRNAMLTQKGKNLVEKVLKECGY